MNEGMNVSYV